MSPGLAAFFAPRSVAVVGASRDPSKVGGSVLANLRAAGFAGRIVPVNPGAVTVQGMPAVASVKDIEGPVDLAVITVPAPEVLPALRECARIGAQAAVVISAGFREIGGEGARREAELRSWLAGRPLRVLGPNCLGWIRPAARLNVTFAPGMPLPGGIAFVSHSGALAVAILDWARDRRVGFSLFASLGNQADLNESDLLEAATEDPQTRVITAYLEGVADGRRFLRTLAAATRVKPVVLLKAGRSAEGARAVSSHTGALAGSDQAFDAAVKQAGAVRARTVEELFDLARALASQPLPTGRRLVVVTNGGGLGIVATDAAHDAGLEVAPLAEATRARLALALPGIATLGNPVDLVGDADAARYGDALHALGDDAGDAMLVLLTAQAATDAVGVARAVAAATRGWRVPVAAAFVGGARVAPGIVALEEAGLPCYPFPERAVAALAGMAAVAARRRRHRGDDARRAGPPREAARALLGLAARGGGCLGMTELAPLLEAWGIGVAPVRAAATPADAARAAAQLGFPVALKIASADVSHKAEAGGVALALASAEETARAAETMLGRVRAARPEARIDGFTVQRMVTPGQELLVGMVRDAQFGPVIVVGAGGTYVEALRDTSARLLPLGPEDAGEMLDELRMAPILRGVRGQAPVDRSALLKTICRFAALAGEAAAFAELEINPLMVDERGAVAIDARARLV